MMLSACATSYQPTYFFNRILVNNNSDQVIREIAIKATVNGRAFSCTNVAPYGFCENKFPRRRYEYNPIEISWELGDSVKRTQQVTIPVPASFSIDLVLWGEVNINTDGSITAQFKQESSVRS